MKIIKDKIHLSKICNSVSYKESKKIANKMILFMLSNKNINNNSIGLACNQLGLSGRVIIVKINNKWVYFINPTITYKSKDTITTGEKCLSVPKKEIKIKRAKEIKIEFLFEGSENSKPSNYKYMDAIVIQHEIDHLNGILITDK